MRSFEDIFAVAAGRKGGAEALEALLPRPRPATELAALGDDRYLSAMTRSIFQAGFSWKVIERKWPDFEIAFEGFDPRRWSLMSDEDLDRLLKDDRIVRNAAKIKSVGANAVLLCELAGAHGSAAKAIANWPDSGYIGLLTLLKERGSRLGGTSGPYFLRSMGKDSFILNKDVTAALIREEVVDKPPTSRAALSAVQDAFNHWRVESGRSFTEISRTLALSVGD